MTRARSVSLSLVASFLVASAIGALVGLSGVASGGSRQPNVRMAITHHPGGTALRRCRAFRVPSSFSMLALPTSASLTLIPPPCRWRTRWDPEHRC
jgi:hypothetical protein